MTALLTVLAAGVASFALRVVPAGLAVRRPLPAAWRRASSFVGPAAFAALAAPAIVLFGGGDGSGSGTVARLGAVAVALPVARLTRSTTATLAVGMPALWLLTAATGA